MVSSSCRPFKLNVDAALNSSSDIVSTGFIVRNSDGMVMGSACVPHRGNPSPTMAEAWAILESLQFALDCGFHSIIVESDSLSVIRLIQKHSLSLHGIGLIVQDIEDLCSSSDMVTFQFAPRSCNFPAHHLAELGLCCDFFLVWLEDYPACIKNFVISDFPVE